MVQTGRETRKLDRNSSTCVTQLTNALLVHRYPGRFLQLALGLVCICVSSVYRVFMVPIHISLDGLAIKDDFVTEDI